MRQARLTRDRLNALSKPDLIDPVMERAAQNALLQAWIDELEKTEQAVAGSERLACSACL